MTDVIEHGPASRIRVIDFETTGTQDDPGAEVIELGRIDYVLETATIESPWTALARPVLGVIPPEAKAVHHLTEEMLAEEQPIDALWLPFWDGLGLDDVVAAHNASFEQHFPAGHGRRWICTMKCARVVWPDAPGFGNQVLRYWLGVDGLYQFNPQLADPPHRALPDAYVTAHILASLLCEKTVEELVEISKWPALHTRFNFGKHKGKRFDEAPQDYLEWIRDKSELDEDTKFSARYWLKKMARG